VISAVEGREFALPALEETGATGYVWTIVDLPPELQVVGSEREQVPGAPGAAGRRRFRMRASKPGRFVVRLQLRRPWEPEPREERLVAVTVAPA
jgi:predicted secreted protein